MAANKTFCKACKQRLNVSFMGKVQGFEFEEGFYCENCGTAKVKAIRENMKKNGNKQESLKL